MSLTKNRTNLLTNLLLSAFALLCVTMLFKTKLNAAHMPNYEWSNVEVYDMGSDTPDVAISINNGAKTNGQTFAVAIADKPSLVLPRVLKFKYTATDANGRAIDVTANYNGKKASENSWSGQSLLLDNSIITVTLNKAGDWSLQFKCEGQDLGTFTFTITGDKTAPTITTYSTETDNGMLIDAHITDNLGDAYIDYVGLASPEIISATETALSDYIQYVPLDNIYYEIASCGYDNGLFVIRYKVDEQTTNSMDLYEYIYYTKKDNLERASGDFQNSSTSGTYYTGKSRYVVTKEGTYCLYAVDKHGNMSYKTIDVRNPISSISNTLTVDDVSFENVVSNGTITGQKITVALNEEAAEPTIYGLIPSSTLAVAKTTFDSISSRLNNENSAAITDKSGAEYEVAKYWTATTDNLPCIAYHNNSGQLVKTNLYEWCLNNYEVITCTPSITLNNENAGNTTYNCKFVYSVAENEAYYFYCRNGLGEFVVKFINIDNIGDAEPNSSSSSSDSSNSNTTAAVTEVKEAAPITITYTVKKDDYMRKIAREHGITLEQLIALNPQVKNPNLIYAGQVLVISTTGSTVSTAEITATKTYTVLRGDSLYKIARKNGMTLAELKSLNENLFAQKYIYAGQQVLLK